MVALNEYASSAELKATLELTGQSFADADIALALEAASRAIDRLTSRRFYADADANQVRHYTPDSWRELVINDLIEFTSLDTDPGGDGTFEESWTLNTDFVLWPLNAAADGEPWTEIHRHRNGAHTLPCFERSVKLTGKFGWTAVPLQVKQATVVLASRLMRRSREAPFGVVTPGLDEVSVARLHQTDPDVAAMVRPFRRMRVPA